MHTNRTLAPFAVACLSLAIATACSTTTPSAGATAPKPATAALPNPAVRFAVIGDYGCDGPDEARVAAMVHAWAPDFIVTVGDNNYEHGAQETFDANIAQHYHDYIQFDTQYTGRFKDQGAAANRFFPTLGNHDWQAAGARPYLDSFALPGNERYYETRHHLVEVFAVDSDPHEPDGIAADSAQAAWLKGALAQSSAKWKIVAMHHPPYSTGVHGSTAALQWPYEAWGASAVFAGHDHHYERVVRKGFPYWVAGTGGATLRAIDKPPLTDAEVDLTYDKRHGAMLIEATEEALACRFFNDEGQVIDSYILSTRDSGAPAVMPASATP